MWMIEYHLFHHRLENLILENIIVTIHRAALKYSKLVGNAYLIIGKNKKSEYFCIDNIDTR